ncbi:NAD-dependent epimerase/dehydratase family protein [Cylindrospermopsis curvispora]|uniref:NAD-dependent epimerase/dehydratase family protein n=1 Tax=Cylindrospermopsis curvispora GIHE-G1 TaxID=2666332 RepID=A0A7H0F0D9_9CYAN|nr:NAD-dependent epimerase/dehydratase family protein [Cylindrospermopsis curvispora]QNP29505.1 NAD-dependent epimerase/dehydratase family protein [Cylindrospermopsis curvispora GIHE-G1]
MDIAVVTGASGLIGSAAVRFFADCGLQVVGIDNDLRRYFFGDEASTAWNRDRLQQEVANYIHENEDIRDLAALERIFKTYNTDIKVIIHAAAQPSHDWAATEPLTDFAVNANGTLNLLEMTRQHCPGAVFIFTSTNNVYGDAINHYPLVQLETRWELETSHPYFERGIDETMSIDHCIHTIFGASKVAADIMVQEYGIYYGLKTGIFRGGCLTGPDHSGTQLHGFLAYLMKCAITGRHYTVFGYQAKQVRDNIHSYDLVNMFWHFYQSPRCGEVYNAGGSRYSHCSMMEAIDRCSEIVGRPMSWSYSEQNRLGDHIWWVSDVQKFKDHYPKWDFKYNLDDILIQIYEGLSRREDKALV